MSSDPAATRRIMAVFGETRRVPYLNLEEGDVGVLLAGPLAGVLAAGVLGVQSLALPLAVTGLTIGVLGVLAAPSHLPAWTWLQALAHYAWRPRQTYSAPATSSDAPNERGLGDYSPFTVDEYTQDLTNIARAWPGAGAIERTDGAMEAYLAVDPGNMDFAMADEWGALQAAGAAFANTELDTRLKLHATTRAFPVERLTDTIEDRLEDPDATSNPVFRELLAEYRDTRPREMQERGVVELRYFLGITVDPLDVYDHARDEATPLEKLSHLPLIGIALRPFVAHRADLTSAERRARMFDRLDDHITALESEFVQSASGWTSHRLSTVELFVLSMEFWNGQETDCGDPEARVRTSSVLGNTSRGEEADE